MTYLSNDQIERMAHAAFVSYEFACEWKAAGEAAHDYAVSEFGVTPRKSAVRLAVRLAQLRWQAGVMAVKREIAETTDQQEGEQ